MLSLQDEVLILVPGSKVILDNHEILLTNSKYRLKTDILFSNNILVKLLEEEKGVLYSILLADLKKNGYSTKESNSILNDLVKYSILTKKSSYIQSKVYHLKTSYEFLPKGIRPSKKLDKKKSPSTKGIDLVNAFTTNISSLLNKRESIRDFNKLKIDKEHFSTILWSMYGTNKKQHRVVASAGNSYSITIYVMINEDSVVGINKGIYKYDPIDNSIQFIEKLDEINKYFQTKHIDYSNANFTIIITGDLEYICNRYYDRGYRYLLIETGLILQNAQLISNELNLGSTIIGGVDETTITHKVQLNDSEIVIAGMVVGSNANMDD
ncbi:SagB/ThcOx family dehydrogenase [Bacillus pumilus]|uniref:SagB/ThcOx family dehydrogenase n=1 Tax=Bacillus pumilus TaxID=1408 RepID=UPI00333BEBC1